MLEAIRSVDEIYPMMVPSRELVCNVFNYLNGRINPENPCRLVIGDYHSTNYAEFRKPDIVVVYLASIINDYYLRPYLIPGLLVMVIGHELSHSIQETNMILYTADKTAREFIENTNDAHAQEWIIAHKDEIKDVLGIDIIYSDYTFNLIREYSDKYVKAQLRDYYIHTIVDVVYRADKFLDPLYELFNKYSSIAMSINDSETFLIKSNGEYVDNIATFNAGIALACRRGGAFVYNVITMGKYEANICGDTNGIVLDLRTVPKYYKPIEFESYN